MKLSKRLEALCNMVAYSTIADIGSGHALLPIYLLENGRCKRALATEAHCGPMEITRRAVAAAGLVGLIETAEGDGFAPAPEGVYESAVISGMGGLTIEGILLSEPEKSKSFKQLLLQPQGNEHRVRMALHKLGFRIAQEEMVFEDGKYYVIISAFCGKDEAYNELEYRFGKRLIEANSPVFTKFLRLELKKHEAIAKKMSASEAERLDKINLLISGIRVLIGEQAAERLDMDNSDKVKVLVVGGEEIELERGTKIGAIAERFKHLCEQPIIIAKLNNDLRELNSAIVEDCTLELLDMTDANGFRVYQRTAAFIMVYAAKSVLGRQARVVIEHSINKNLYCCVEGVELDDEQISQIEAKMLECVEADFSIEKHSLAIEEAVRLSKEFGLWDKVQILKYRRTSNVNFYRLDWFYDYFYGHLAPRTGDIKQFKLARSERGFVLRLPLESGPAELREQKPIAKIIKVFQESGDWAKILKADTVGALNDIICGGKAGDFVRINEALHEKRIAEIADSILAKGSKIVLIAGPSSSGKTTFAERLSIQLRVNGLTPHVISLDDYYLNRGNVPLDEFGKPDFETIHAIDIEQINNDFSALLAGKAVSMPTFNFVSGKREYKGKHLKIAEGDILVVEGIHGLNELTSSKIPPEMKFKIVISALTQLNIDDHNRIPTSDTRLIRRIVRDRRARGFKPEETIAMWPSVLRGEEKYIFPYQESADAVFNSALVYELCVLKHYVEPILFGIQQACPEYTQARRLVKFLDTFIGFTAEDVPPNSILREFIGGSCFRT